MAQLDADHCEFDGGQVVIVSFVVAACDSTEVLEAVQEALGDVALVVALAIEGKGNRGHGFGVCDRSAFGKRLAQPIGVMGAIGEQGAASKVGSADDSGCFQDTIVFGISGPTIKGRFGGNLHPMPGWAVEPHGGWVRMRVPLQLD